MSEKLIDYSMTINEPYNRSMEIMIIEFILGTYKRMIGD